MRNIIKNILIGALPTAYAMVGLFIITLTGYSAMLVLSSPLTIIGLLLSVKIISIEFALRNVIYTDKKERLSNFIANSILLALCLTVFSFS